MSAPRFLDAAAVSAELMGLGIKGHGGNPVSPRTVNDWFRTEKLPSVRIGGRRVIEAGTLMEHLKSNGSEKAASGRAGRRGA